MSVMRQSWAWCVVGLIVGVLTLPHDSSGQDEGAETSEQAPPIDAGTVAGLRLRGIGPALMSGRISDIAIDPERASTWYVSAASGGVWKTVNAGTTWSPIFDRYGSYSIGCVAVDPNNRHVVWVGTGENNSQRSVGYGDGLYKSLDGGQSFTKVGLEHSEHIAKILIHPKNSDVVYVAAQGPLWSSGGDRGLYKTTDGGATWNRVLEISENTGVSDIHFDPRDPDTIYASAYQRRRHVWTLINGGPESGVYKTTDGGKSWRKINNGLPAGDKGRIGLAVSPQQPDVVYALVEASGEQSGFYRSSNRGETWSKQGSYNSGSPQYYQEIVADPHVFDRIYSLDTYMMVSEDGGRTFERLGEQWKHVDNHALIIDPADPDHLIIGCDGGVYETWDRGQNYDFKANLPLTQFYKVAVSNDAPFYYVYGGTQDNATQGGPSRTNNVHGIRNSDWFITVFGDGFDPAVDPENPDIIYSQWQYGGLVRYDRGSGNQVDIKPQTDENGPPLRWNWDSALLISPHAPNRIYYASQILFRSDDRGDNWEAISPDLSRNMDRNTLKVMGRIWGVDTVAKNNSTSMYGSIVALDESPLVEGLLYAGTDDGLVQISDDHGENWRRVDGFPRLEIPEYAYVNDIEASLHDADTVYVALNNHKKGDFKPYIVKSNDRGRTWSSIAGNLPERGSVYTLKQDHVNPDLLFAGTEFGVYFTVDEGLNWTQLKGGMPTIAVREIEIQRRESDLVLATFGRGFYILDDYSPLRHMTAEAMQADAAIFPIKKALLYEEAAPLAVGEKAFQGAGFFTAPNPDFGATFTFHLKESLSTKRAERQGRDSRLAQAGQDTPYPSWEELKEEDREESPFVFLTIHDSAGNVVRRMTGPSSQGLHRVTWDLRFAGYGRGPGPLAVPGTYSVSISKYVDGAVTELVGPTAFQVEALGWESVPPEDREAVLAFQAEVGELQRAVAGAYSVANEAATRIDNIKDAALEHPTLDPTLRADARALEIRLLDLLEVFSGDPTKPARNEAAYPGINSRIQQIIFGHWSSSLGNTGTHRKNFEIAQKEFKTVLGELRTLVETDLPALEKRLDEAGVPWSSGRRLPDYN